MAWDNAIVGQDIVDARSLVPNPRNWRVHSNAQGRALSALLDETGWIQRVIVNRTTGHLVDGHLRAQLAAQRDESIPVSYIDVTEEQEGLILATLDPLSAMASSDEELLASLQTSLPAFESAELQDLLDRDAGPNPFALSEAPITVKQNVEELKAIRAKGNREKKKAADTERYLVIVYPNRDERERAVENLGLPKDERYISANAVRLRPAGRSRIHGEPAALRNSGATG